MVFCKNCKHLKWISRYLIAEPVCCNPIAWETIDTPLRPETVKVMDYNSPAMNKYNNCPHFEERLFIKWLKVVYQMVERI